MSNNISRGEVSSAVSSAEQTNAQSGPADNLIEYYGWNIFSYLKDKWNQIGRWRSPGLYDDIKASRDITYNDKEVHNDTSNVNFRYSDGSTPLTRALKLNDQTNLEYLLNTPGIDLDFREEMVPTSGSVYIEPSQPPLIVAVKTGQKHLVKQILDAGANVNSSDSSNDTALFHSTYRDYVDITELLLQYDPVLECVGDGYDPIHVACEHGNFNIVKMLVTAGCSVDPKKDNLVSPLLYSIQNSSEEICLYLLEHGADIYYKGSCDTEPFILMCQMGLPAPVKFCIDTGIDVNMRSNHGMTALMLATKLHNYVTQRFLLIRTCESVLEPAVCDLYQRRIHIVKCLINAGCDLDLSYELRNVAMTALFMAVRNSNLPVAVVLLKHGAVWDDNCHNELKSEYEVLQKMSFIPNSNMFILKKYIPKILALIPHKYRTKFQKETNKRYTIPSLKDSCRKVICQCLKNYTKSNYVRSSSIWPLIPTLNLPTLLKSYLCYNEINEEEFL